MVSVQVVHQARRNLSEKFLTLQPKTEISGDSEAAVFVVNREFGQNLYEVLASYMVGGPNHGGEKKHTSKGGKEKGGKLGLGRRAGGGGKKPLLSSKE